MTILFQYRIYPTTGGAETVWSTTAPIVSNEGGTITTSSTCVLENIEISNTSITITNSQSPYTAPVASGSIVCNTSAGTITINLPDATLINSVFYFTKTGTNTVTITAFTGQTIDGNTSYLLTSTANNMIALQSSNGGWTQYLDTVAADSTISVNFTTGIKNKTITDRTNTVLGFLRPGNMVIVDSVNGNDSFATRGGLPYLTLTAALSNGALSGDTVWLLPGTQSLTSPIVLASGVSILGFNTKFCIINYAATASTSMFTMTANNTIENVTINLTSATAGIILAGVQFPLLTTMNSKIRGSVINVTNTAAGAVTIYGIYANGYGIPLLSESPAIHFTTVNTTAAAATSGMCYGLYLLYVSNAILTNQMYIRNSNFYSTGGGASSTTLVYGVYIDNSSTASKLAILNLRSCSCIGINTTTPANSGDLKTTTSVVGASIIASGVETSTSVFYNLLSISPRHIIGNSSLPTIVVANVQNTASITGTDLAGQITVYIHTSGAASSVIVTVTFAAPYTVAPNVIFCAGNLASSALATTQIPFMTSTTTTFLLTSGTVVLPRQNTYVWNYIILQ